MAISQRVPSTCVIRSGAKRTSAAPTAVAQSIARRLDFVNVSSSRSVRSFTAQTAGYSVLVTMSSTRVAYCEMLLASPIAPTPTRPMACLPTSAGTCPMTMTISAE